MSTQTDYSGIMSAELESRNRATSRAELVLAHYAGLSACGCYVHGDKDSRVTTWMSDLLGHVVSRGKWHRQNGSIHTRTQWRQITVRALDGHLYTGREYDCQQIVRLRACAS